METLWSPWRTKYIDSFKNESQNEPKECFFCKAINSDGMNEELLIVSRRKLCIVIMNRYPYNSGHLLVAPNKHVGDINELNLDELTEIMLTIRECTNVLTDVMKPQGFNIGTNLGRSAGAGVPEHIHFHVIPRWNGDSNFISTVSDLKVISQSMDESYKLISESFFKLYPQF